MKKALLLLATLGCTISWARTYATTIAIDLGPPRRVTGEKIISFNDLNEIQFSGQTLSLDLVFIGNNFVRLINSSSYIIRGLGQHRPGWIILASFSCWFFPVFS